MSPKQSPPETLRQAQTWETTRSHYESEGLCHRCAAQAAWAHQNFGDTWNSIHPPCARCAVIVASFPLASTNLNWRKCARSSTGKFLPCVAGPAKALLDTVTPSPAPPAGPTSTFEDTAA